MTTAQFSVSFAVLSLACWGATVVAIAVAVGRRARPGLGAAFEAVAGGALWLAWLVATVTTAGSLYYSLVAHFDPCELCWYQRICMYPLSAVLLVAAVRRDAAIWKYVLPQAVVGAVIAVYHMQLQAFPAQVTFCSSVDPCTARYVWEFGFVSLPFMSLSAFCFVIVMVLFARAERPAVDECDPSQADELMVASAGEGGR
ncbi:MAG TPA: disulfide bond formation protein B [Acidimicrobiales bacterium]|nr:disulfide bond formation protein B [Acidimicrobiales bacterium]